MFSFGWYSSATRLGSQPRSWVQRPKSRRNVANVRRLTESVREELLRGVPVVVLIEVMVCPSFRRVQRVNVGQGHLVTVEFRLRSKTALFRKVRGIDEKFGSRCHQRPGSCVNYPVPFYLPRGYKMLSSAAVYWETPAHAAGRWAVLYVWHRLVDLDEHLAGIVERDERAFARWLEHAEPTIRASLRGFAAQVDTEAVLQETLLRVWQTAPRVERDRKPNSLLRFSFRIARNLAISELRRARLRPTEADEIERKLGSMAGGEGPEPPDPMLRRVIKLCRDKLPPKPRQVLDLRVSSGGGASDKELAAKLDMTKNTFLQNFTRARKTLAECLSTNGVCLNGGAG